MLVYVALSGGNQDADFAAANETITSVSFRFDMTQLNTQQSLLVGLLDSDATEGGFGRLHFKIRAEQATVFEASFDDSRRRLALLRRSGARPGRVGRLRQRRRVYLELVFLLRLDQPVGSTGFTLVLVVGNATVVPLPAGVWLLLPGLVLRERGGGTLDSVAAPVLHSLRLRGLSATMSFVPVA